MPFHERVRARVIAYDLDIGAQLEGLELLVLRLTGRSLGLRYLLEVLEDADKVRVDLPHGGGEQLQRLMRLASNIVLRLTVGLWIAPAR